MLFKADGNDACDKAFAEWRAMIPFWNSEADRFRAIALSVCRDGRAPAGIIDDIETVLDRIRAALRHCDALLADRLPGDYRLTPLVNAAGEFEALLESLHDSRERIEDRVGRIPPVRTAVTIGRASGTATVPPR